MTLPSVAVVGYNRPAHLKATLGSLAACERFEELAVTESLDGAIDAGDVEAVSASRVVTEHFAGEHGASFSTSV